METEPVLEPKMYTRADDLRRCEVCGNEYDKCMEIRVGGMMHIFDSFECAAHALAPRCAHCGCMMPGAWHGVEWRLFLLRPLCQPEWRPSNE